MGKRTNQTMHLILSYSDRVLFLAYSYIQDDTKISMTILDAPNKNFGLDAKEFDRLVEALKRGNTDLFKSIFKNHFKDCVSYIQRKYAANYDDAYDASMATILDFRKRLVDDKIAYGNLRFLFTKMASQHFIKAVKGTETASLDNVELPEPEEDGINDEDIKQLSVAWNRLDDACKELLQMNYYGGMKLAEIALQLNKSATAIRKQKERCKSKLINLFHN